MHANIHVVPRGAVWAVKREGVDEPVSGHLTQDEAEEFGRARAKIDKVEFELHSTDGASARGPSHGNGPSDLPG